MIKGVVVSAIAAVLLSACSVAGKKQIETVPADFIIEQDSSAVNDELNELHDYDHQVIFKRKQFLLTESEKSRLLDWLQATQPAMVGVRGTGGAQRYRELGYNRARQIISFLRSQRSGVDMVVLDYDAALPGSQGLLTVIPDPLAEKIKISAPILIISSN